MVEVKVDGSSDSTYVTRGITTGQSFAVERLASGTWYTIRVYAGAHGVWDGIGANISAATQGAPGSLCGNGLLETGEQCEIDPVTGTLSACCNATTCHFAAAMTLCRASNDTCTPAVYCPGGSSLCPPSVFEPDNTACNDGNACTIHDKCSSGICLGVNVCQCKVDQDCATSNQCVTAACTNHTCVYGNVSKGGYCSDGNACTINDQCDGHGQCHGMALDCSSLSGACGTGQCSLGTCISIPYAAGTLCRNSTGVACDLAGYCDGVSPACPPDTGSSCIINARVHCIAGKQYQSVAPTATTDRVCANATICNYTWQYDTVVLTATADRTCGHVSGACQSYEYEQATPTASSDRICKNITSCGPYEIFSAPATPTSDTVCISITSPPTTTRVSLGGGSSSSASTGSSSASSTLIPIIAAVVGGVVLIAVIAGVVIYRARSHTRPPTFGGNPTLSKDVAPILTPLDVHPPDGSFVAFSENPLMDYELGSFGGKGLVSSESEFMNSKDLINDESFGITEM